MENPGETKITESPKPPFVHGNHVVVTSDGNLYLSPNGVIKPGDKGIISSSGVSPSEPSSSGFAQDNHVVVKDNVYLSPNGVLKPRDNLLISLNGVPPSLMFVQSPVTGLAEEMLNATISSATDGNDTLYSSFDNDDCALIDGKINPILAEYEYKIREAMNSGNSSKSGGGAGNSGLTGDGTGGGIDGAVGNAADNGINLLFNGEYGDNRDGLGGNQADLMGEDPNAIVVHLFHPESPVTFLTNEQLDQVMLAVDRGLQTYLDSLTTLVGNTVFINDNFAAYNDHLIKIRLPNPASLDWLMNLVQNFQLGFPVRGVVITGPEQRFRYSIRVRNHHITERLFFKGLVTFNPGVDVTGWKIVNVRAIQNSNLISIILSVPEAGARTIERRKKLRIGSMGFVEFRNVGRPLNTGNNNTNDQNGERIIGI